MYQDGLASYLGVSGYNVEFRARKKPTSDVHGPSQVQYSLTMPQDMWQISRDFLRPPSPNNDTILRTLFLLLEASAPVLFSSPDCDLFSSMAILHIYLLHCSLSRGCPRYDCTLTNYLFYNRFSTRVGSGMGAPASLAQIPRKVRQY